MRKFRIVKTIQLDGDMSWDEEGIVKVADRFKDATYRDFFKALKAMHQDPEEWDWEYEEDLDEELGLGTIIIRGEKINGDTKETALLDSEQRQTGCCESCGKNGEGE